MVVILNVLAAFYQGWYCPLLLPEHNRKELINELFIQLNTYFMLVYSDFVADRNTRYTMGFVNIGCLGLMLVFNLIVIGRA